MNRLLRTRGNQVLGRWGLINLGWWLGLTSIAGSLWAMVPKPAFGAEEISLNYGILELKIKVDSLEKYAQKGQVEPDLKSLIDFMSPSQRESLKTALATPIAIDVVSMAQLFYSPEGAAFLGHVGELLQTPARQSGFYALRAGLIRAADREDGLTIVNILKEFPLKRINLNSVLAFDLMGQVERISQETNQAFTAIGKQQQKSLSSLGQKGLSNLPDLRARGNVRFAIDTLTLKDPLRDREFIVDLYRPQLKPSGTQTKIPLIVISHGLAANRYSYQYLAEHLASHGWMVAIPEHRGSNFERFDHLLQGLYQEAIPDRELIDRPLDISFLLDTLLVDPALAIDPDKIGMIGQSFGAYTALALASDRVNFSGPSCQTESYLLNPSLIVQCQGQQLQVEQPSFSDRRIKSILLINALTSNVFTPDNLASVQVPVMMIAATADVLAPPLSEQIKPYTRLGSEHKYLVLWENASHFSSLQATDAEVSLPQVFVGPDPAISHDYLKVLALSFFDQYLLNDYLAKVYLDGDYATYLSKKEMPLKLIEGNLEP